MTARSTSFAEIGELAGVAELLATLSDRVGALEAEVKSTGAELQVRSDVEMLVAHELRTPLTVLRGALDTLESASLGPVEAKELICAAARHARRACKTVDELLEAGLRSRVVERAVLQVVVFGEVALEAVATLEHSDRSTDVVVEGADVTFMSSPARLRAIVVNLLSNAFNASPNEPVECSARLQGDGVRIEVSDRGCGIREPRPRFQRPTSNDDRTIRGLFVVGMLAESLGGRAGIDSRIGGGAVAWCELPLRRQTDLLPGSSA